MIVNKMAEAIARALGRAFGDEYTVYYDADVVQRLDRPCFFIAVVQAENAPLAFDRSLHTVQFDVHFFAEGESHRTLHDVADRLHVALEIIADGDMRYRGFARSHEVIEGVLHFSIMLQCEVDRHMRADAMQDMAADVQVQIDQ